AASCSTCSVRSSERIGLRRAPLGSGRAGRSALRAARPRVASMMNRLAVAGWTLAVLLLAGCTTQGPAPTPTPAAESAAARSEATPTAAPTPVCSRPNLSYGPYVGEPLDMRLFEGMVVLGPRESATGTVAYAEDGSLAWYVVAPDDNKHAIVERLCMDFYALEALNAVRRGSVHSADPTNQVYLTPLYAG